MADTKPIVLVIEDDQFLRELLLRKLAHEKIEAQGSIDGEDGLEKIKKLSPALVLLDLMLPVLDGFEVLKRVRRDTDPARAKLPIVILSNLGQESDIAKGKDLGANDYMVKANFTTEEIINKIRGYLK